MKRYAILTLALALCGAMLVGCGCMNTGSNVTTLPTNGETSAPPTRATTAPTTVPTTMPETQVTDDTGMHGATDTTGTLEGALDDITGHVTEEATGETDMSRGRQRGIVPRG